MKQFKDNEGRTWDVSVNVATIKRVRDLADVDLMGITDGTIIEQLIRDPVLLCNAVYAACKPQADEQGVSDEDFGRAMAGDAIEHATNALLEDLVAFSPSPRDRKNLGQVLAATNRLMDRARDLVEQKLTSGELEREAEEALAIAGLSSTSAPESSGSTPTA